MPRLLARGHELMAICSHERPLACGIQGWRYKPPTAPPIPMSLGQQLWFEGLQRSESVVHICKILDERGWVPDRILAHSGWGETLGIHLIWPDIPQILWPELWMRPQHGGYGLDPQLPPPGIKQTVEQLGRNALTQIALEHASAWVMPTRHQAESLPPKYQNDRLHVVHEGIDCSIACPNPDVSFNLTNTLINSDTLTITFVNRNLERLRGFDVFMRALPFLMRKWENLRVIIVGDNDKGYGMPHPSGQPLRQVMTAELSGQLDFSRVHFLGKIPHNHLISVFQASTVHVYLSYPFVLGWSLLEAMSCGCCIVGSEGMPVSEIIQNGVDGLLVPMTSSDALANRIDYLLSDSNLRKKLGHAARLKALEYDHNSTLPLLTSLVESPF